MKKKVGHDKEREENGRVETKGDRRQIKGEGKERIRERDCKKGWERNGKELKWKRSRGIQRK